MTEKQCEEITVRPSAASKDTLVGGRTPAATCSVWRGIKTVGGGQLGDQAEAGGAALLCPLMTPSTAILLSDVAVNVADLVRMKCLILSPVCRFSVCR